MITNNLKQIRKDKKLTQQDIAEKLQVKQQTIAHYENGQRELTQSIIVKLCKILQVSADDLLGIENV